MWVPASIFLHDEHVPQASPPAGLRQFSALAKFMAVKRFPTPSSPANRYEEASLPLSTAPRSMRRALSCPITSLSAIAH